MSMQPSYIQHPEDQYLELLRTVWTSGDERSDRTGVGTRSIFGATVRYSLLDDQIPLLTTKKVAWKVAAKELLWFLSGSSNIRPLVQEGVHIWTDWPLSKYNAANDSHLSRDEFESRILGDQGFAEQWGDLGPVYGVQWTNWDSYSPSQSHPGLFEQNVPGINQIARLVEGLKNNPTSRRHIFTGWNVAHLDEMALPPCHMNYQFYVNGDELSCILYQRSCDLGLGYAFNVFSASLLTKMLAQQCGLRPRELIWNGGDVHVYLNHAELVKQQLTRRPVGTPKLRLVGKPDSIFDYRLENFEVFDYQPHSHISAPVAV